MEIDFPFKNIKCQQSKEIDLANVGNKELLGTFLEPSITTFV